MYRAIIFSVIVTLIAPITAFAGIDDKDLRTLDPVYSEESPCSFRDPLKDLTWLKNLHKKYPDYTICMYKKNGKVLFKIFRCGTNQYPVTWYDCMGNKMCPGLRSSCANVQGAHLYRCIYEGCDGGGTAVERKCEGGAWFRYPRPNSTFPNGSDVYVLVTPRKIRDIASIELYINGTVVRKDTKYPYEWGKGPATSDKNLRNLKPGTYKLKCLIETKCGQLFKEYLLFYIK